MVFDFYAACNYRNACNCHRSMLEMEYICKLLINKLLIYMQYFKFVILSADQAASAVQRSARKFGLELDRLESDFVLNKFLRPKECN